MCSTLGSAATALLQAVDAPADGALSGLGTSSSLTDEVLLLARVMERTQRALLERTARLDAAAGAGRSRRLLCEQARMSSGSAERLVSLGRRLYDSSLHPRTRQALDEGRLQVAHARVVLEAVRGMPAEHADAVEAVLVETGTRVDPAMLARAARHAVSCAHDAVDDAAARTLREAHRELFVTPELGGLVAVNGRLTPQCGEALLAALAPLTAPRDGPGWESRTAPQRRHDALEELCRRQLDAGQLPDHGGERPHLSVQVDLADLSCGVGTAQFSWSGATSADDARLIACDAVITRVVVDRPPPEAESWSARLAAAIAASLPPSLGGSPSQILDVGRASRLITRALRRALVTRDRGCSWAGCGVPAAWCDAHHIVHWANGGKTTLANLRLLCRRHHRAQHELDRRAPPGG